MSDTTRLLELLAGLLVAIGAGFMLAAFLAGRRTASDIPSELLRRWRLITAFMAFFLAGYILFAVALLLNVPIPEALVAGTVFFGGAVFVFLVVDLTRRTLRRVKEAEQDLRNLTESLERQVADRARAAERRASATA